MGSPDLVCKHSHVCFFSDQNRPTKIEKSANDSSDETNIIDNQPCGSGQYKNESPESPSEVAGCSLANGNDDEVTEVMRYQGGNIPETDGSGLAVVPATQLENTVE